MSDAARALALKHFVAELNRIWKAAGPPSFAEFEAMSRKFTQPLRPSGLRVLVLAHATTQGILAGRRRTLPKWPWVASFVIVLRTVAARNGINPDSIGTLEEWKARHAAADEGLRRARSEPEESDDAVVSDVSTPVSIEWLHYRDALAPTAAYRRLITFTQREQAGCASVLALARQVRTLGWWQDYRDIVPEWFEAYLSLEPAATRIRSYETEFIPDLLQTEAYAEAALRQEHSTATDVELRRRVELRMLRQQILHRPEPTMLWIILDEGVARQRVGGNEVMRAQLDHLIELSQRTNITVQVIRAKDGHAVVGGSITVLRFADQALPDLTFLQQPPDAIRPPEPEADVHFGQVLDRLGIEADAPIATADLLHAIRADI